MSHFQNKERDKLRRKCVIQFENKNSFTEYLMNIFKKFVTIKNCMFNINIYKIILLILNYVMNNLVPCNQK